MSATRVNLQLRALESKRPVRRDWEMRGFFAESVDVCAGAGFDYQWSGSRHYLALHDIRLRDGEASIDGVHAPHILDLRQTLTFAPKGCQISGWSLTENRNNNYLAFTYEPSLLEEEFERSFLSIEARPLLYFNDTSLGFTLEKIKHELKLERPDTLYLETLCLWTALEVERLTQSGKLPPASGPGVLSAAAVEKVREYIHANLAKDISLSELASVAGLSRFHFSRSFKKTFGLAPRQYLLRSRVERAKTLIAESDPALAELSILLGFNSPARLSAAFRRYGGGTIAQYRRENREP
jgi:AraC family transcriptional regulator